MVIRKALLVLFLLIAVACLPVVIAIAIIYNSPSVIFFPPLNDGDTVQTVMSAYFGEFNGHTATEANNYIGYDRGEVIYVGFEGDTSEPNNYYGVGIIE